MTISQQQKTDYIQAMGISQWLPRVKLTNAPAPIQFAVDMEASNPKAALVVSDIRVDTQQKAELIASEAPSPAKFSAEPSNLVSKPQPESRNVKNGAEKGVIRFGLALYVMGDWLVCSSLSSDYQAHEGSAVQLISNILKVFGTAEVGLAHHHIISWPFFSNPNASQGIEPAKQYVNGVIEHLVEEHKVSKMLVCGGVLAKLNQWQSTEGNEFNLTRLIIPSVYKMLVDPSEKAKAWQIIQQSTTLPPVSV